MHQFRVWAPAAERVELVLGGRRHPMERGERGYYSAALEAAPGADYGFSLDGGDPLPDPRSRYQPRGVHGPSRLVDTAALPFAAEGFRPRPISEAVIYELHVGTFSPEGTFEGAIARLDHLAALGVTHVELMPVNEFAGRRGWGYDGVGLYAPHSAYGGPRGLARLVDACHGRGLAVILDVVYNHLGPAGNYLGRFGPYFTERYSTPWGPAVNLDGAGSDEVRRFFIDNALYWLTEYRIDGLRFDAEHALLDTSPTHLLEELAAEARAEAARAGRVFQLIAESDRNDPRLVRPAEAGGFGLDAQWSDDFHHALHAALTGERGGYYADFGPLATLARALTRGFAYDGRYSPYRDRRHGRAAPGLSGHQLLGYLQNHDQIGNRARGERASHLLSPGLLKVGAALVLAAPFVPMLFQGEEWGASTPFLYFTDHEPELGEMVREGRRREFADFGWRPDEIPDPQAEETFLASKLKWGELSDEPHASLLEWHRRLISLRRELPDLSDGRLDRVGARFDEAARWLVVERGAAQVIANLGPRALPLPVAPRGALRLSSAPLNDGALAPESVAIFA